MSENRIEKTFKNFNKKALVTFLTAGDPDFATTRDVILEMAKNGVDLVEIGVPFSDPIAEGPVIQEANVRAIEKGANIIKCFELVKELRTKTEIPLVFLLYYNCVLKYGVDEFFKSCKENGVDGVIIPDLPYEEKDEISESLERYNIIQIPLVAPTSKDRVEKLVTDARGFVYCVSSLGVTGVRTKFHNELEEFIKAVKKKTDIPAFVGFGIHSSEQVKVLKEYCDGVIIGSAIVKIINNAKDSADACEKIGVFIREIKTGL